MLFLPQVGLVVRIESRAHVEVVDFVVAFITHSEGDFLASLFPSAWTLYGFLHETSLGEDGVAIGRASTRVLPPLLFSGSVLAILRVVLDHNRIS